MLSLLNSEVKVQTLERGDGSRNPGRIVGGLTATTHDGVRNRQKQREEQGRIQNLMSTTQSRTCQKDGRTHAPSTAPVQKKGGKLSTHRFLKRKIREAVTAAITGQLKLHGQQHPEAPGSRTEPQPTAAKP